MIDRDDDPELDALARALRAETLDAPASTVASTRTRVVASAKRRSGGPSWALAAAAMLAIVLGGSTVWAFFTGRLSFGEGDAPVEEVRPRSAEPEQTSRQPRSAPREEPVIVAPEPEPPEHSQREHAVVPEVEPAPPAPEGRTAERPIDPAERRAYDAAHALHFDSGDWPAAIDAWSSYLASFPRGHFVLEARYNRALALVRAGREEEARAALAPFAEGRYGAYRRSEARSLLEALAPEPTP